MEHAFLLSRLERPLRQGWNWLHHAFFDWYTWVRLGVLALAVALAYVTTPPLLRWIRARLEPVSHKPWVRQVEAALESVLFPLIMLIALALGSAILHQAGIQGEVLRIALSLVNAWIIIRLTTTIVADPTWSQAIAITAWLIAALNILNLLNPLLNFLDATGIRFGTIRLSVLSLVKAVLTLIGLLWGGNVVSRLLEQRLRALPHIAPAVQVLIVKLAKAAMVTIAILAALTIVGIDLTAFAVFSGAVGVGLGFGLQKVVSNLISGVILLLDRSIKPGDVIEVGGTYGWITRLNARYVSVITRDNTEYLIPNEDLITQRVVNWSYTNELVRLRVPVGISYDADVRKAMALCVEAVTGVSRALSQPKPVCLLTGFGDSSVNLELRFWIRDPQNGTTNVRSEVMLGIWDRFRANDIQIPYPQRDVHLKAPPEFLRGLRPDEAAPDTGG